MTLDELAERQYGPPWAEQRPERWRPYPSNSHHQDAARRSNEGNVCYVNSNVDVRLGIGKALERNPKGSSKEPYSWICGTWRAGEQYIAACCV